MITLPSIFRRTNDVVEYEQPPSIPPVLNEVKQLYVNHLTENIVYGPFSKLEISLLVEQERIDADTLVCFYIGRDKKEKEIYGLWEAFGRCKWNELLTNPIVSNKQLTSIGIDQRFWFRDDSGNEHGPFHGSAINKLIKDKLIHASSLVYLEGGSLEWKPLKHFIKIPFDQLFITLWRLPYQ